MIYETPGCQCENINCLNYFYLDLNKTVLNLPKYQFPTVLKIKTIDTYGNAFISFDRMNL